MPKYTHGDVVIETSDPYEAAALRRDGFVESDAKTKSVKDADAAHQEAVTDLQKGLYPHTAKKSEEAPAEEIDPALAPTGSRASERPKPPKS